MVRTSVSQVVQIYPCQLKTIISIEASGLFQYHLRGPSPLNCLMSSLSQTNTIGLRVELGIQTDSFLANSLMLPVINYL
jgi:hypothetical protein